MESSLVKFITWNCKGLNGPVKRNNILSYLKKVNADIIFLQETHLKIQDHNRLKCRWIDQVFHSSFNAKSRGTAILIKKNVPFITTKIIPDPQGRYIIITGKLYNHLMTLVNIYAPNMDDEQFITSLITKLPDMDTHQLIIGGDFNFVLNTDLDRSSRNPTNLSKSAKTIQKFMEKYKIIDPWRTQNPNRRQYSFYSPVHQTYTRIDFFLIDYNLLPLIKNCDYETIMLSDHSPVQLQLKLGYKYTTKTWRFDNSLLSNEQGLEEIRNQIIFYLSFNDTLDTKRSTLWETLKAYIRGQVISWKSLISKQHKEKENNLKLKLQEIDRQHSAMPSAALHRKKLSVQTELELTYTMETVKLLTKTRHKYYEQGEKISRVLAQQIKKQAASRIITEIRSETGLITKDLKEINSTFKKFYIDLYTSESQKDPTIIEAFFKKIMTPTIKREYIEQLEQPITKQEIEQAINNMQNSKAPGPDGYTSEFYKAFKDQISPILLEVYNEAIEKEILPPTFYQANISVIHKTEKDPLNPASYRPISLINVDNKILAKILATRLEKVLPTIISQDQTGFIKDRQLFFNTRRLLNIIHTQDKNNLNSEILLSLDAEKAFDRVEWDYLFLTLSMFGFGSKFTSLIKLLYAQPTASVQTNNTHSEYFALNRSTRQGCPLSPLLFALAIEPLAILLRSSKEYAGITRGNTEHKVSLYADDLLLYVSDPIKSIPIIMTILEDFGRISGYKLNLSKSILFPINSKAKEDLSSLNNFPFAVTTQFKYLGINITQEYSGLFKHNYSKLYEETKKNIDRWISLPISLAGRINIVRMNILPKFLFLFQNIPILITKSFFNKLDSLISYFIWNKKTPKIKKTFLQRPPSQGGMGLPCFRLYYWSCNIRSLSFWLDTRGTDWTGMEKETCKPISLRALIYSALPIPKCNFKNPVVSHSIKIWTQIRKYYGWNDTSIQAPLTNNQAFTLSISKISFLQWNHKGLQLIKDLFIDNIFPTFQQLQQKFNLNSNDFFKYLQIRSFIKSIFPSFPGRPPESPLDKLFLFDPFKKGLITKIHNMLSQLNCNTTLEHFRDAWQKDLGVIITDSQWTKAQENVHSSSVCIRHGLLQFKVLHRLHLSKLKLSRMFPSVCSSCDRCKQQSASLAHMFWSCPCIGKYWKDLFQILSSTFKTTLKPDPLTALFGVVPNDRDLANSQKTVIRFVTLLARRLILLNWKQKRPPTLIVLMRDIMKHLRLENIRFTLKGKQEEFYKTWQPFIEIFEIMKE